MCLLVLPNSFMLFSRSFGQIEEKQSISKSRVGVFILFK